VGQVGCAVARKDRVALAVTVFCASAPIGAVAEEGAIENLQRSAVIEDGATEPSTAAAAGLIGITPKNSASAWMILISRAGTAASAEATVAAIGRRYIALPATRTAATTEAALTTICADRA
jgi:hypothetical protein